MGDLAWLVPGLGLAALVVWYADKWSRGIGGRHDKEKK